VTKAQSTAVVQLVEPSQAVDVLTAVIRQLPDAGDTSDAADAIVARILSSETLDEAMVPASAPSLRDLAGKLVRIHDAQRRPSDLGAKYPFYLLLDVEILSTGQRAVYSSGAEAVMAIVARAWLGQHLPFDAKVQEIASKSNPGQSATWLVKSDRF
jgi:hypothetical protein